MNSIQSITAFNLFAGVVLRPAVLFLTLTNIGADDWSQWRGPNQNGISTEAGFSTNWPADGPKQLWKKSVGAGYASVVISQGLLFTAGNSNEIDTVVCLDAETGQQRWAFSYPSPTNRDGNRWGPGATPTVDGSAVYALSLPGDLFCFEARGKIWIGFTTTTGSGFRSFQHRRRASPPGAEFAQFLSVSLGSLAELETQLRMVWSDPSPRPLPPRYRFAGEGAEMSPLVLNRSAAASM